MSVLHPQTCWTFVTEIFAFDRLAHPVPETNRNSAASQPPRPQPPQLTPAQLQHPPPVPPSRPPPPAPQDDASYGSGRLFSSIEGGAGSLFRQLKDTSSRVMQTVQQ